MKLRKDKTSAPILLARHVRHSSNESPPLESESHEMASFLLHFLPRLMFPNTFFIRDEKSSSVRTSLSRLTSNWENFHDVIIESGRRAERARNKL